MNRRPHRGQRAGDERVLARPIEHRHLRALGLELSSILLVEIDLPLAHVAERFVDVPPAPLGDRAVGQHAVGGRHAALGERSRRQLVHAVGAPVGAVLQEQLRQNRVRVVGGRVHEDERREKLRFAVHVVHVGSEEARGRCRRRPVRRIERHRLREPAREPVDVAAAFQEKREVGAQPRGHGLPQRCPVLLGQQDLVRVDPVLDRLAPVDGVIEVKKTHDVVFGIELKETAQRPVPEVVPLGQVGELQEVTPQLGVVRIDLGRVLEDDEGALDRLHGERRGLERQGGSADQLNGQPALGGDVRRRHRGPRGRGDDQRSDLQQCFGETHKSRRKTDLRPLRPIGRHFGQPDCGGRAYTRA